MMISVVYEMLLILFILNVVSNSLIFLSKLKYTCMHIYILTFKMALTFL